jgi:hypothetical protein
MARRTYGHSDQTFQVLIGNEAAIALELDCDPTYIYGIKNRTNPDPYPKFRELFRSAARAGGDVSFWLNDLQAIQTSAADSSQGTAELTDLLLKKVQSDGLSTEEIIRAISDGHVDAKEANRLIKRMDDVIHNAEVIKKLLLERLAELLDEKIHLKVA